jgi:hypothetical protein
MSMRSQVYSWDLFGGTASSGAILTFTLAGAGTGYGTGDGLAATSVTGSGSGAKFVINSLGGSNAIASLTLDTTAGSGGSGYKVGDKLTLPDNGTGTFAACDIVVASVDYNSGNSHISLGTPFSIFTDGKGNGLGRLPNTTATQFIVIDSYGCTPSNYFVGTNTAPAWVSSNQINGVNLRNSIAGPRAYLQININTTGYFKDPDGVPRDGIPGTSIPYPRTIQNSYCKMGKQTPIYILPGQVWDVRLTCYNDAFSSTTTGNLTNASALEIGQLQAFIKYTLYDGADALIANKLMEMGIAITPDAVDNYKQKTIEAQMAADARKALQE